jgi:hypothetical protein
MALSRRTFTEGKRYETVVFQENTHPGDFEVVELQDIQNREREALAQNLITDGFLGDSFKVFGSSLSNAVNVTPGAGGYSVGRRLLLPDTLHPLVGGQYIYNMLIATPATNRVDLVYLDIFIESVTPAVDPDIQDVILGPTASRERVRYNFAISQNATGPTPPTLPSGHVGLPLALITRRAADPSINAADVVDVRPLSSFNAQFKPKNLIVVSPAGGDFHDPAAALNSINGLTSAANPYTILIRPGVYTITQPLNFIDPYVSMIGTDPYSCVIKANIFGFSTARISADHITLKNLKLEYTSGSGSHAGTVFSTGAFNMVLDNLVLAEDYYNENNINAFQGIDLTAGGIAAVRNCKIFAQNTNVGAAVAIGASAIADFINCTVLAAQSDALSVANGAVLTLRKCSFIGTRALLVSGANMNAQDCSWANQALKAFSIGGAQPMTLTQGVTNTMVNCSIDGLDATSSITDTSAIWNNVTCNLQLFTSGGGQSYYDGVVFSGIDVNGTYARFTDCTFNGTSSWAIGGTGGTGWAIVVRGTTSPVFLNCKSDAGNVMIVLGGNPTLEACIFTSSSASARLISVLTNSSNVIVTNCLFQLFASYALASPIFIGSNGGSGRFTYSHNHLEGSSLGQPDYVLRGSSGTGAALFAGDNTSTAGALREPTSITVFTNSAQNP